MPIIDMHFENNLLFARQVGHVDGQSARQWVESLAHYAARSKYPIGVVMDATCVESVSNTAKHTFVRAVQIPNVKVAAVATSSTTFKPTARVIEMMADRQLVRIFPTVEEAVQFVQEQLQAAYSG